MPRDLVGDRETGKPLETEEEFEQVVPPASRDDRHDFEHHLEQRNGWGMKKGGSSIPAESSQGRTSCLVFRKLRTQGTFLGFHVTSIA